MKFMTSDQVQLDYTDEGQGQPVLIQTGIGGYKEIWQLAAAELLKHGYRVINLDSRNQGQSEHTVKGRRISKHAVDLHELIKKLNLEDVILMGNSMGAATMFAYLSLFGDENIATVIDVDQSPKMIADKNWPYGFNDLNWDNFPEYLQKPFGSSTYQHIDDRLYAKVKKAFKKNPYDPKLNYPLLVDHGFQDWRDVVQQMNIPMLIICGKQSPYFDYHFASAVKKLNENVQVKIINHSGHIVMGEQPEKFNKVLIDFLKKI